MSGVVLLVMDREGGVNAVRFATDSQAREWEDAHPGVECIGLATVTTKGEALRRTRTEQGVAA